MGEPSPYLAGQPNPLIELNWSCLVAGYRQLKLCTNALYASWKMLGVQVERCCLSKISYNISMARGPEGLCILHLIRPSVIQPSKQIFFFIFFKYRKIMKILIQIIKKPWKTMGCAAWTISPSCLMYHLIGRWNSIRNISSPDISYNS